MPALVGKPHVDHRSRRRVPQWIVPVINGSIVEHFYVDDELAALKLCRQLIDAGHALNPHAWDESDLPALEVVP